ncbi:MAG: NUDIX hydrolase [bacterium]
MIPKRISRKVLYKSKWIDLYIDKVLMPSGKIIEKYHVLDYPKESVAVLLTNKSNEICMIKTFRYTTQDISWELPAGCVEKGEEILMAAEREVLEETGFTSNNLRPLFSFFPSNGMSNQKVHVILGNVKTFKGGIIDSDEVKEVVWLSESKITQMIQKQEITDGISLLPLLFFFNQLGR